MVWLFSIKRHILMRQCCRRGINISFSKASTGQVKNKNYRTSAGNMPIEQELQNYRAPTDNMPIERMCVGSIATRNVTFMDGRSSHKLEDTSGNYIVSKPLSFDVHGRTVRPQAGRYVWNVFKRMRSI